MRALLISDVHSNLQALEAVLAAAPQHDVVWNLGDVVGYGANPNEVIGAVRRLGGSVLRGNHDRACGGMMGTDDFSPIASYAVHWTQSVLKDENRDWLRGLVAGPIAPNGPEVSCVHGSPVDEDEYILWSEDACAALEASAVHITFFGHTHKQGGFASNGFEQFELMPQFGSRSDAEEYELPLRKSARYILNPGSVGQPRDGDWRAAFAIYDDAEALLTWYRVPYNILEAQRRIRSAGLPHLLATRLHKGQ